MKLIPLILSLTFAVSLQARMMRVVSIDDHRTVTVEHDGQRQRIQLAGVEIVDPRNAAQLLRWTIGNSWVMAEAHASGGWLLYRSPDALFVNRELVIRGYARATAFGIEPESNLKVTYLGQVEAPLIAPAGGTRSDTRPRSTASPSPAPRRSPSAPRASAAPRSSRKARKP